MIYILILFTAFFNAIMDVLKDKFSESIFQKLNPKFWNPNESWMNKYKNFDKSQGRKYPSYLSGITDTFSDIWHISKFCMILCIIIGFSLENDFKFYDIPLMFIIWGATFKLFYTKFLIK